MMTLYFISGLGADKRAFIKLALPKDWTIKHIEWIENLKDESLSDYCRRLSSQIDYAQSFSLIGLSFGGIVAVEMAKFLTPARVVIISSISTAEQLPIDFFGNILIKKLKLYKLIPSSFFKQVNTLTYWLFGTKTKDEKDLLRQIINDTPPEFAKWAIGEILTWNNIIKPKKLLHLHGAADRIFPVKNTSADIIINNGGHFMIYSNADEISKILTENLG